MSQKQQGFSAVEALLILVVIGILGFTGWYVYHARQPSDKDYSSATTTGQNNVPPASPTVSSAATKLIAVAKQVIFQQPNLPKDYASASSCGSTNVSDCPFTEQFGSQLTNHVQEINQAIAVNNDPTNPVGPGNVIMGFPQNGPFGTVSYSAVPDASGGTVTVTLAPPAADDPAMHWVLTIQSVGGKLLVSDITLQQYAAASVGGGTPGTPACGPVQIDADNSCFWVVPNSQVAAS